MASSLRVAALVAAVVIAWAGPAATVSIPGGQAAPRIVAIGDIHGSAEGLDTILRAAGLVDAGGKWIGGSTLLVQTGDYTDRGDRVRDVLDTLMQLEENARQAGGRAEILMGNHEVMNLMHDFRDVSPGAYATFADDESEERLERAYREYASVMTRRGATPISRNAWKAEHPPGFVEYVDAIGPHERYGRWLRERKVVVKAHGTIFMHAGIADTTAESLDDVNRTVAREIENGDRTRELLVRAGVITPYFTLLETLNAVVAELRRVAAALEAKQPLEPYVTREYFEALQHATQIGRSPLFHENGPLWFRGFALWPDEDAPKITALLERYGAERFVTGHTPIVKGIASRFDGRVFLIDTGMLSRHYNGEPSALELQGDTVTAIYADRREPLSAKQPVR